MEKKIRRQGNKGEKEEGKHESWDESKEEDKERQRKIINAPITLD